MDDASDRKRCPSQGAFDAVSWAVGARAGGMVVVIAVVNSEVVGLMGEGFDGVVAESRRLWATPWQRHTEAPDALVMGVMCGIHRVLLRVVGCRLRLQSGLVCHDAGLWL